MNPPPIYVFCSLVYFTSQPFVLKVWSLMFLLVSPTIMDFHGDLYCFSIYISLFPIQFLVQRLWCKINKQENNRGKSEQKGGGGRGGGGVLPVTSPSNYHQEHWVRVWQCPFEWIIHLAQNKSIIFFFFLHLFQYILTFNTLVLILYVSPCRSEIYGCP